MFIEKIRDFFVDWLSKDIDPPRKLPLTDFERIQYELRLGDVLLLEGRSRVSQIIKLITQSSWSHAVLYIGRLHDIDNQKIRERIMEFYKGEPNDQLVIESLLGKGVIITPLEKYRDEHIRICRPKGISRHDAQQVIGYVVSRLGRDYDVRQIFDLARFLLPWAIFPRRWRTSLFTYNPGQTTKESCSTLIAEAFSSVDFPILPVFQQSEGKGMQLLHRSPRLYSPSDFDYSPFFEIIKYPIIELSEGTSYHKLPWNREGFFSDDEGHLYPFEEKKAEEEKENKNKKPKPKIMEFFD